jgi:Ca2+-binding RTX toxin-like protein
VGGMISGIRNVTGGQGNDLIVGDKYDDVLNGGGGNNVIIGGGGQDMIFGGDPRSIDAAGGSNLLIAGTTDYDKNKQALMAIFKEWSKSGHTYAVRVANLHNGGGLNGKVVLTANSVHADKGGSQLTGGPGMDWFWGLAQEVTNLEAGESFN